MVDNDTIKIVFFTKAPIGQERVKVLEKLLTNNEIEIQAVVVEEAIHLPFAKFIFLTLSRIWRGGVRIHDLFRWGLKFFGQLFVKKNKNKETKKDPLKILLKKYKVPMISVKNTQDESVLKFIKSLQPDLGVVYVHRLLPKKLFSLPKLFTINLHPGILPKYAGGDPCFWALVDNCDKVGVTVHKITSKADAGDIVLIKDIPIGKNKSHKFLVPAVTKLAPMALCEAILKIKNNPKPFLNYSNGQRTYRNAPSFFIKLWYRKFL